MPCLAASLKKQALPVEQNSDINVGLELEGELESVAPVATPKPVYTDTNVITAYSFEGACAALCIFASQRTLEMHARKWSMHDLSCGLQMHTTCNLWHTW